MKKVISIVLVLFVCLGLTACDTSKEEIDALNSQIEELEAENAELQEKLDTSLAVTDNEPIVLSGTIIVGSDIPAGSYDIKPAGSDDTGIKIYEDEAAKEAGEYEYEWLFPGDEDNPEGDVLKSYILREGNILAMSANTEFTKLK